MTAHLELQPLLDAARAATQQERPLQAEAAYARVLSLDESNVEALHYLGTLALSKGAPGEAVVLLDRAVAMDRTNPQLLLSLGMAFLAASRLDEARFVLERSVELRPGYFLARLHLASVLEEIGYTDEALVHYFRAVMQAQSKGRWLNAATTAPTLRDLVLHAMNVIDAGRKQRFLAPLEALRSQYGEAALARVDHCLDLYLSMGTKAIDYPDPRQRPKFLFFPDLPPTTYFDRALFPWYETLERNIDVIRDELQAVLRDEQGIEPFLQFKKPEEAAAYLAGGEAAPAWDAFFFYRHGVRNEANCARCPRTAALIDALPVVRIREHAPEICFSVLTPGTHILPHRGVTNTRLVTHLPLIVPENCAINVGGELREWREGECFSFDDTFEHEAWNRGNSIRVVMLLDCWNPYLTDVEREALAILVGAIGDLNREAKISDEF